MPSFLEKISSFLSQFPKTELLLMVVLLVLVAWITNFVVKRVLLKAMTKLLNMTPLRHTFMSGHSGIMQRIANIAPALVIYYGIGQITELPETLVAVVKKSCEIFFYLISAMIISHFLDLVNTLWMRRPISAEKPIKGYLQVLKIIIYCICIIYIISDLMGKDPAVLLTGLGAMAAVLMLIFQDTILSFVASVQISSNNMIKLGDWIEMPQLNADGDVIDIALHTIKIQNWDKTITTIPTKKFLTDSFKNWRGMVEAGGRRIKRSIFLDQNSIHFLTEEEWKHLHHFSLLKGYLDEKEKEISEWNEKQENKQYAINRRRITNIGTFRAYVDRYLHHHPKIHSDMTLLVRQLDLTSRGLPLEIYCFTNDIRWAAYEDIQSDIFDHLLAILPEFGLRVFQEPSGLDLSRFSDSVKPE